MTAAETLYDDAELVALYDRLNPAGADTDFYRRLARPGDRILDIGCGTGLLTRLLADDGHAVTGVEPSAAMLTVAPVSWVSSTSLTVSVLSMTVAAWFSV